MLHDQKIFLVTQNDPEVENQSCRAVYQVGTVAYIKQVVKLPQDLLRVLVEGIGTSRTSRSGTGRAVIKAETALLMTEEVQYAELVKEAMFRSIQELFQRYCMENGKISKELAAQIMNIDRTGRVDFPDCRECTFVLSE